MLRPLTIIGLLFAALVLTIWLYRVDLVNLFLFKQLGGYLQQEITGKVSAITPDQVVFEQLELAGYDLRFEELNLQHFLLKPEAADIKINAAHSALIISDYHIACKGCTLVVSKDGPHWSPANIQGLHMHIPEGQAILPLGTNLGFTGDVKGQIDRHGIALKFAGSSPLLGTISGDFVRKDSWRLEAASELDVSKSGTWHSDLLPKFKFTHGTLYSKLIATPEQLQLKLNGANLDITWDKLEFKQVKLQVDSDKKKRFNFNASSKTLEASIPMQDLRVAGSLAALDRGQQIKLQSFQGKLFDGQLQLQPTTINLPFQQCQTFSFNLDQISLADLLTLYNQEKIKITGHITGKLPLKICGAKWTILPATFTNSGPGQIQIAEVGQSSNAAADFAFQALRDFKYDRLRAELNMTELGDMTVALQVAGISHSLNKTTPIVVNLNVADNIFSLLRSLRISESFTRRLREHFKSDL